MLTQRREVTLAGDVHMSDSNCGSRYSILVRLLVTKHVCNVFEVEIVLILVEILRSDRQKINRLSLVAVVT